MTSTYCGTCSVMRFNDLPYITHADPQVKISDELIKLCKAGDCYPWMSIDGDVLTIKASNRTVVYQLTGARDEWGNHLAEWPD